MEYLHVGAFTREYVASEAMEALGVSTMLHVFCIVFRRYNIWLQLPYQAVMSAPHNRRS
jgi:hypothetical protein